MTATFTPASAPESIVPPIRQHVVDQLMADLARDDLDGFTRSREILAATGAEVAAASAGLVETGQLDLAPLQHSLEVLESLVRLPGAGGARAA